MMDDIPNRAIKIRMLSAWSQCYLPLHSHSPCVICHTCSYTAKMPKPDQNTATVTWEQHFPTWLMLPDRADEHRGFAYFDILESGRLETGFFGGCRSCVSRLDGEVLAKLGSKSLRGNKPYVIPVD
jgi:hypothetical protein